MLLGKKFSQRFRERLSESIRQRRIQRNVDLYALGARHLHAGVELKLSQQILQEERHLGACENVRAFAGIEIEYYGCGDLGLGYAVKEWMQFQTGRICAPDERRQIVDEDVADVWPTSMTGD